MYSSEEDEDGDDIDDDYIEEPKSGSNITHDKHTRGRIRHHSSQWEDTLDIDERLTRSDSKRFKYTSSTSDDTKNLRKRNLPVSSSSSLSSLTSNETKRQRLGITFKAKRFDSDDNSDNDSDWNESPTPGFQSQPDGEDGEEPEDINPPIRTNKRWSMLSKTATRLAYVDKQKDAVKYNLKTVFDRDFNAREETDVDAGHNNVKEIDRKLNTFDENGLSRSVDQCMIHKLFTAASARNIYGKCFKQNELEIMRHNGWTENKQQVMVCTPRRFGKTYATGMYVVAYALSVPNCEISVFSPASRQSELMLKLIRKLLFENFGDKFTKSQLEKDTNEHLYIRMGPKDLRKINAYPSSVEIRIQIFFLFRVVLFLPRGCCIFLG